MTEADDGPTLPDLATALQRFNAGETWDAIGPDYGRTGNSIRKAVRRAQMRGRIVAPERKLPAIDATGGAVAWTETGAGATLESDRSGTIRTLDDLLAACDVDLSRWTVARYVVNKWDSVQRSDSGPIVTQLYQVKAWLEPIKGLDAARELFAGLLADMANSARVYEPVAYPPLADDDRHMAVISLADLHIGALSWGPETGAPYDVAIAERLAGEAMADMLRKIAVWNPERILFILGNDLLHTDKTIDGKGGSTTRGTIQETDGRWQRTFRIATRVSVTAIDAARQLAPVDVHCKAGNHDTSSAFMLGDVIGAWYRNDESVSVVNDPAPRTYVEYGASMIGICHGHNEKPDKLPILMATEAAGMWARTTFRDWMTGHRHRKGVLMNEESGVQIYTMPSLCAPDSWHVENAYGHRRSSEARIYHRRTGPAAHLIFNVQGGGA